MEMKQLEYFLALCETLHFGKAASMLYVTEKPISHQIKKLEEELGFKLFDRTTRRVSLTPAGEEFRRGVAAGLSRIETARESAASMAAGNEGVLTIGYDQSVIHGILPQVISLHHQRYLSVEIIPKRDAHYSVDDLSADVVDAYVTALFESLPAGVDSEFVCNDEAVVAVPRNHRLAERSSISIDDIRNERILAGLRSKMPEGYRFIEQLSHNAGFNPNILQTTESYLSILGMVALGQGVSIVLKSMKDLLADKVAYIPLVDPPIEVRVCLIWKHGKESTLVENLRNTIVENRSMLMEGISR